nr:uncharacterized protein LOC128680134 [Plodia interpunctella]
MEALVAIQMEYLSNLQRAEKNYRKSPKERIKKSYVETRLEMLDQKFMDFKEGHKQVILNASKDRNEAYFTNGVYDEYEDLYVQYKTTLREALESFLPSTSTSTVAGERSNSNDAIKLPRLILPTFSGAYQDWQTFYDMFLSLIHNNKNITPVQKLHYLKGNLSGEARDLLRNFSTTDANYEEAWKQLVRRYNNKRYNCNAVMKNLFAPRKINSESSLAIKQLVDNTSSCLKSLQNMGINITSWDTIIIFLVISKLDSESVKLWEQHLNIIGDELPSWEQLREFLESRFRALEMIDTTCTRPSPTKPAAKAKTFHTAIASKQKSKEIECAKCNENHYIYHCKQFEMMSPRARQDFVQNGRLCFNCLSPTHTVIKCRQSNCRKCGRKHHTMLHFEKEERGTHLDAAIVPASGATATASSSGQEGANSSRGDPQITVAFSRGGLQPDRVLLATARVKVLSTNGCKYVIRALLDQGSQASFLTEATAQLLGLKRKSVSGWVSGLGDSRTNIKHSVSLRLESRHSHQTIYVNAYVLPSLTSLLPACKVSKPVWSEIDSLPLADPTYTIPGKIDILLGAEVYAESLLDGMLKNPDGIIAYITNNI